MFQESIRFGIAVAAAAWDILLDSSIYILFGIVVAGLVKVSLNAGTIANHLGRGRYLSVIKSAFFGVPLPL